MEKTLGIDKKISVSDNIRFVLETTDGAGCLQTPYQITKVVIYFVNREFTDSTATEYEKQILREDLTRKRNEIKKQLCVLSKEKVRVASTSNIILNGFQTIDGIDVEENNRILVKNQLDLSENGIYVVSSGNWKRSGDANDNTKLVPGSYCFVEEGIDNIGSGWVLDAPKNLIIGTTGLSFFKFSDNGTPSSPNGDLEKELDLLNKQIEDSKKTSVFYYKDAVPVKIFGGHTDPQTGELFPAWLNPQFVPTELKNKTISENILEQYEENFEIVEGKFVLKWRPLDCREGDYFICWSWRPTLSSEILSHHLYFSLEGDSRLNTSLPTHYTAPNKYEILMERYLPEMFKNILSESDLSPLVLKGFNDSVGAGFTFIENQANQIIDLFDANATHEQLLPLLSNLFNLKLKSNDPTLWRRQIKKAIPNFKKKGSISGLKEALSDIGMKFLKLTRLWQINSKYTYQEHFVYKNSLAFSLSHNIVLPIDSNFELWFRSKNGSWEELTDSYGTYVEFDGNEMTWIGPDLEEGDSIRVLYKILAIPTHEQYKEEYIRLLPLLDDRDEKDQDYPPKNWNTRALEEDDPMFEVLIPSRHPLADPIIWGKIRTEFPYSENAYNMDEYNGSKRDSYNPCDIDKEFIDTCGNCQSSKYNLDLEVEKLSDESFNEARQLMSEFMPFHSVVHTFNLSGAINEFIKPSEEKIDFLVTYSKEDVVLAGEGQLIFNKDVVAERMSDVRRDILASFEVVMNGSSTTWEGTIKNQKVSLLSYTTSSQSELSDFDFKNKTHGFESVNVDVGNITNDPFDSSNLLEILGTTIRNFSLKSFSRSSAELNISNLASFDETLVGPLFEYRISNLIGDFNIDLEQHHRIIFYDENADFYMLNIVTQYDIDENNISQDVWKFKYGTKQYSILNLLPDGSLLLEEESTISAVSGWELTNGTTTVATGSTGNLFVTDYGIVTINSPSLDDIREKIRIGDSVYFDWGTVAHYYPVKSFKQGDDKFYIEGYNSGSLAGEPVKIYRRILENKVGQIGYEGVILNANDDIETNLSISNGANYDPSNIRSDNIKENYLICVTGCSNTHPEYYTISSIDGGDLTLKGLVNSYTLSGESVSFTIYKFNKSDLSLNERIQPPVPKFDFKSIDRSGGVLLSSTQADMGLGMLSKVLNSSQPLDVLSQSESIDFQIEYKGEN